MPWKRTLSTRVCVRCSTEYTCRAGRAQDYCSKACANAARTRLSPVTCPTCSLVFKPASATAHYCSKACMAAGYAKRPEIAFAERVIKRDGCWGWTGMVEAAGYGLFDLNPGGIRTHYRAHRFALEQAMGSPLPPTMSACHVCDTPSCTKNDEPGIYVINGVARPRFGHLWLGTHAENVADMWAKGRGTYGSAHPHSKLNEMQVKDIVFLLHEGRHPRAIGPMFGVSTSTIKDIASGTTWKHVNRP